MKPIVGQLLMSTALLGATMMGVTVAMSQRNEANPFRLPSIDRLFSQAESTPIAQLPQGSIKSDRSQDVADQFQRSKVGQSLSKLSQDATSAVEDSKAAITGKLASEINGLVQRTVNEQRDAFRQLLVDSMKATIAEQTGGLLDERTQSWVQEFNGVKLNSAQEAQIQEARQMLRSEIKQLLQTNPDLLSEVKTSLQTGRLEGQLAQPIDRYSRAVASVLTPEQQRQWQQNFRIR